MNCRSAWFGEQTQPVNHRWTSPAPRRLATDARLARPRPNLGDGPGLAFMVQTHSHGIWGVGRGEESLKIRTSSMFTPTKIWHDFIAIYA